MRDDTRPATEEMEAGAIYELQVAGPIGPLVRAALPELTARFVPTTTALAGTVRNCKDLHRMLEALAAHGLTVAEVRVTNAGGSTIADL